MMRSFFSLCNMEHKVQFFIDILQILCFPSLIPLELFQIFLHEHVAIEMNIQITESYSFVLFFLKRFALSC